MEQEFNLSIPIQSMKSASVSENDDGDWVFEGIASTDDVDLYDEVVYPENFLNTIEFFKDKGKIYFDHDYAKESEDWLKSHGFSKDEIVNLKSPIGKPIEAELKSEGLYIKGILNKSHPMSKIMWEQYLNNPDENFRDQIGLSIGAKYMGQPRREYDVSKGKYVTYLPDLLLYEVSMTPEPVNPHTKTWASVLKSMIRNAEDSQNQTPQYHTIQPDSVVFDEERGKLAVKSTVEGSDGVVHVFESYIDVKEDVKKAMEDNKAMMDTDEQEVQAGVHSDAQKAPMDEEMPQDEGAEMMAPEGAEEEAPAGAGEMAEMMDEAVSEAEGEEEGMESGDAMDALDQLVGAEEEGAAEPEVGEPQPDDSQELVLDKLDTVLDTLMTLADALHDSGDEGLPGEGQVETEMVEKSIDVDSIKSVVQEVISEQDQTVAISEESTESFTSAIKSVFEGFEDRVVEKVVHKLTEETTVTQKSVKATSASSEEVVSPGVAVDNAEPEEVDLDVQKSVYGDEEEAPFDMDTVKSLASKYIGIQGYTPNASQERARVVMEAERQLNMSASEFRHFIRKAEKGQL